MWLNPIVKKDVKVQARSFKMCVEVFVYEIIMALVFLLRCFLSRVGTVIRTAIYTVRWYGCIRCFLSHSGAY